MNDMKKVCGTCIFGYDCEAGESGINVFCAFDYERRPDSGSCSKWKETRSGLSKKDKIDLANRLKNEKSNEQHHQELLKDSKTNRKNQFLLLILSILLGGVFAALLANYIWSLWFK